MCYSLKPRLDSHFVSIKGSNPKTRTYSKCVIINHICENHKQ